MKTQLHVLLRPADDLVKSLMESVAKDPEVRVEVVDLSQGQPDYPQLVERIFAADSVATW